MADKKKDNELDINEILAENEKLKKENASLKKDTGIRNSRKGSH